MRCRFQPGSCLQSLTDSVAGGGGGAGWSQVAPPRPKEERWGKRHLELLHLPFQPAVAGSSHRLFGVARLHRPGAQLLGEIAVGVLDSHLLHQLVNDDPERRKRQVGSRCKAGELHPHDHSTTFADLSHKIPVRAMS